MQLPAYNVGNALDFRGLNSGLDSVRENKLAQAQLGMQQQQLGMQKERLGMEREQFDAQKQQQIVQRFAGIAQGIDGMQDPAQRQAAWQNLLSQHPQGANLPAIYRDPIQGPKLLMQEAQGFMGKKDQAQIGLIEAQTLKARREAAEAGGGFGREIKPYQTSDGQIWGVQAGANGDRLMHNLSDPTSPPIHVRRGQPMPPGTIPQGGSPVMGQQSAMPQGGASVSTPGMPSPQAGPSGPLTPFRGTKQVGDEMIDIATGQPRRNVGGAIQGEAFIKKDAEAAVADIKARNDAIQASRGKMPRLQLMSELIDRPDVYQGTGGNAVLEFKKAAQAIFGMDLEGIPASEAVRMVSQQFALALRNPAGGEGMPGALSDRDLAFLVSSTPGLTNTRGGNQIMARVMLDLERHKVAENTEANRYLQKNRSTAGLSDHMQAWAAGRAALSKETRDMITRSTGVQYGVRSGPADGPRVPDKMGGRVGEPPAGRDFSSPALGGSPPAIRGDDDYNALPSGAEFIGPDGKRRRKP